MSKIHSAVETIQDRGVGEFFNAVVNLSQATFASKILGKRFIQKQIYSYQMWLDLKDQGISRTLILFGKRELDHKIMLEDVLKPGMRVFDIGANIGYYALMELGLVGEKGQIIAIEPSPENVKLLKRNLELNQVSEKQVTVLEAAISDQVGQKPFFLSTMSNLNTFHTQGTGTKHLSGETIDVQTLTVKELTDRFGKPDLIRMDVEGHEVEILSALLPLIRSGQAAPHVIFETHISRYSAEHDMGAVLKGLFDLGYTIPVLASSQQSGTDRLLKLGYRGKEAVRTDGVVRTLFNDVMPEHAIDLICRTGGVRTVLLKPPAKA